MCLLASSLFGQGLRTSANKDDWEEINFEFNSATLVDGFPSLLRIAELLGKNPGYSVKLEGHADALGSHPFNDKLAMRRANAVKDFLLKYGAKPNQVTVGAKGKRDPKVDNATKDGRFMNRRVTTTVLDDKGRVVGAGGPGDAIAALEKHMKQAEECCNEILKRLDKLDEILALLRDMKAENARLRADLDALKGQPAAAASAPVQGPPPAGVTPQQLSDLADAAARKAVADLPKSSRFSIVGLNAGPDGNGDITMSGRARYFGTFGSSSAVQAQGEYMYFRDRREGQFDIGLVNRWKDIQVGGFSSFRNVWMRNMDSTGTLGQASFTADYLFGLGKVGVFGSKAFLNDPVIKRVLQRNRVTETYLHAVDQLGASGAVAFGRGSRTPWLEGNIGWLKSASGNAKAGGTARLIFPVNNMFALTAEGGVNETLIGGENNGRAVFGVLFGNYMHPKEYRASGQPVPVDIPRVRYEVLTRTTRTGNDPPVADAGPDQIGVRAGTIQLDGSASFDPDGDPITFSWTQIAGPTVALAGAETAKPSFTAAEGQAYAFRLLVKDNQNAQGIARVTVTTREAPRVRILRFTANPPLIQSGGASVLNYLVENADSVTISGVTQALDPNTGAVNVSPAQTTSYVLTARNRVSEETQVAVVAVERLIPRFVSCSASPATILPGEASTLSWQSVNAASVEIVGVGSFGPTGSTVVSPQTSTTYTLIARSEFGEGTCTSTVQVQTGSRPSIQAFSAAPVEIVEGDKTTLTWRVDGADMVSIDNGVGNVNASGSADVMPVRNTTYTLTAKNRFGESMASASVVVYPRARIVSFTATPSTINQPFAPVTFDWRTENALDVFITEGLGTRPPNGSLTNTGPRATTTYKITAMGRGPNNIAMAEVTVTVDAPPPPVQPPVVRLAQELILTPLRSVTISASGSFDPQGGPVTFQWTSLDGRATIASPNSPTTTITMNQTALGDFPFEVRVTNSKGVSSAGRVIVRYIQAPSNFPN
jgi:hypothetical protein